MPQQKQKKTWETKKLKKLKKSNFPEVLELSPPLSQEFQKDTIFEFFEFFGFPNAFLFFVGDVWFLKGFLVFFV